MWKVALVLVISFSWAQAYSIAIGAFNIQAFSTIKRDNLPVRDVLIGIIRTFDIILIQEIRMDVEEFRIFINFLNIGLNLNMKYGFALSNPLGPSTYQERYAYIYRSSLFNVQSFQYVDTPLYTEFDRPPYLAYVTPKGFAKNIKPFWLAGLHTRPCNTIYELIKLENVNNVIVNSRAEGFITDRVIFMGDFNADGEYFRVYDKHKIPFLFSNGGERTVQNIGNTNILQTNEYDRIVTSRCLQNDVSGPKIFNFNDLVHFPTQLRDVSDHFPVRLHITDGKSKPTSCQ